MVVLSIPGVGPAQQLTCVCMKPNYNLPKPNFFISFNARQWRTEKPGMLQSMGSPMVGHDLVTEQKPQQSHLLMYFSMVFVCSLKDWATALQEVPILCLFNNRQQLPLKWNQLPRTSFMDQFLPVLKFYLTLSCVFKQYSYWCSKQHQDLSRWNIKHVFSLWSWLQYVLMW